MPVTYDDASVAYDEPLVIYDGTDSRVTVDPNPPSAFFVGGGPVSTEPVHREDHDTLTLTLTYSDSAVFTLQDSTRLVLKATDTHHAATFDEMLFGLLFSDTADRNDFDEMLVGLEPNDRVHGVAKHEDALLLDVRDQTASKTPDLWRAYRDDQEILELLARF